jgi:ABC-type Fe3+-hydroxamate transport system substrate-binding protein
MPAFTDQTGRTVLLQTIPQRIISLVPSQTELLFDLGLDQQVAGITKFCVHPPEWSYSKTRVGGTKKLQLDIIHQLQPDLIIANKEENVKEQIEELAESYPAWVSDVNNLEDACEMIAQIGIITGTNKKAIEIADQIKKNFAELRITNLSLRGTDQKPRTCYLIWNDPYMTVGADTFIHSMLEACGFKNIFDNRIRYPEITIEELQGANCQLLLLSSEPYPFREKHIDHLQPLLPGTKIVLVNGEMFSWYGSHLLHAPAYFKDLKNLIANPGKD